MEYEHSDIKNSAPEPSLYSLFAEAFVASAKPQVFFCSLLEEQEALSSQRPCWGFSALPMLQGQYINMEIAPRRGIRSNHSSELTLII